MAESVGSAVRTGARGNEGAVSLPVRRYAASPERSHQRGVRLPSGWGVGGKCWGGGWEAGRVPRGHLTAVSRPALSRAPFRGIHPATSRSVSA